MIISLYGFGMVLARTFYKVCLSVLIAITLVACAEPVQDVTYPDDAYLVSPPIEGLVLEPEQSEIDEIDIEDLPIPHTDAEFTLTDEELALFDEYITYGDISVFYGADPVSVIKILIQSGIYGHFEREFMLFHPDTLFYGESLESYLEGVDHTGTPALRQSFANLFFSDIDEGVRSDVELLEDGHQRRITVSFFSETSELLTLSARTNDEGIWLVERFR